MARFDEPVAVVQTLGNDRNPVIIHRSVEGGLEAELRDGVLYGVGESVQDAMLSLAENLDLLALAVRKGAHEYRAK